ncbi:ribosomal-processing cysteine protease Prp [Bacillus sp. FJAT-50079]|uniref:ribosomal-processing cysteine protease Prp n=1 Tax=Bacillus sp. FJAT-50079 TaxID=2833577 RepID=UPI001BCA1A73|nr:ribosomal-processing cysteine protease Prp [Bacillus sp. FJAT-50079]MBS4208969.1 ribosomal-processing cysteine protease Prp [Bacillus sp. FJAT-50079]
MIKVQVVRKADGTITSFTMRGHADYAEHGQDIVCAGASAVAFGSINALFALTEVEPVIEQSEGGYLTCTIPDDLSDESFEKAQLLLEGMIVSLQTIERDYQKYIRVTFQK